MDIIKSPQKDINSYLFNDYNIETYNDLTLNETNLEMFDPLFFFNLLYDELNFFIKNEDNYLTIKNHFVERYTITFKEPNPNFIWYLEDERKLFFLERFDTLVSDLQAVNQKNEAVFSASKKFIRELYSEMVLSRLSEDNDEDYVLLYSDFKNVKQIIEAFPNTTRKIEMLIEFKYDYLQRKKLIAEKDLEINLSFDKQCEFEIEKLKRILELETNKPELEAIQQQEPTNKRMQSEFSVLEWATIFYYANSCKYFNQTNMTEKQAFFIEEHNITTSKNSFKNKVIIAKNAINKTQKYSIDKLNYILPFVKEKYSKGVAFIENDKIYLDENNKKEDDY